MFRILYFLSFERDIESLCPSRNAIAINVMGVLCYEVKRVLKSLVMFQIC
jgi:hypothetical protein